MESFYERAKELADKCTTVKDNKVYSTLSKEFGISEEIASDRFKSFFQKGVRDYIIDKNTPSKEVMRDAIIRCDSQEELLKFLGIPKMWLKGIYDKYFNVSTFHKAKLKLTNEFDAIPYNPTIEDNLSILISQKLGDGSFEFYDNRSSLKIEHGYKQYDYLKFKINLLKKAFPTIPGLESIHKRVYNGYTSYSYRTNNIRNRYMEIIKNTPSEELLEMCTPFGILLWYLDDGSLTVSKSQGRINSKMKIAIYSKNMRDKSIEVFKTYGFDFYQDDDSIYLSSKLEIMKFLNSFVKPYIHLIPECMHYKCNLKI